MTSRIFFFYEESSDSESWKGVNASYAFSLIRKMVVADLSVREGLRGEEYPWKDKH